MRALAVLLVLAVTPATFDMPPEGYWDAADATATAERLDPPAPAPAPLPIVDDTAPPATTSPPTFSSASSGSACTGARGLLEAYSPGWDVGRMSRIMYRESRCQPGARNRSSSATGLLQILASHCPWLAGQLGTWCTRDRLTDPVYNVRAAAALWREQGYGAWSTSRT